MGDDAFLAHLVDHPEQQLAWSVTVDIDMNRLAISAASSNSIKPRQRH